VVLAAVIALVALVSYLAPLPAAVRSLEERHNALAARLGEEIRRLEGYVDRRVGDLLRGSEGRRDDARPAQPGPAEAPPAPQRSQN
jgi:hypothetical protein